MKKVFCILLCMILIFTLTACTQELPPADQEAIAQVAETIETLNQTPDDAFPVAEFAFDNETPADQAKSVENVRIALPYMSDLTFWTDVAIAKAGILLRYNKGRYYSINPRSDGGYDIYTWEVLSGELLGMPNALSATWHYPCSKGEVNDAETFFKVVRVGASQKKIEKHIKPYDVMEGSGTGIYILDNGMTVTVFYDSAKDGKVCAVDLTVNDIDDPRSLEITCDFAYLLPQDLALIS